MIKHGMSGTRIYRMWSDMVQRCENPCHKDYPQYGGRNITVFSEWHIFSAFFGWAVAHGYSDNLTLDRKNNDGNYEPDNIRFVTTAAQGWNRRTGKQCKSGVSGVWKQGGKYIARLGSRDRRIYLGAFSAVEEASAVVERARRIMRKITEAGSVRACQFIECKTLPVVHDTNIDTVHKTRLETIMEA